MAGGSVRRTDFAEAGGVERRAGRGGEAGDHRWLRPEFQNPGGAATTQQTLGITGIEAKKPAKGKRAVKPVWPKDLVGQVSAVRQLLAGSTVAMTSREITAAFKGGRESKVTELLAALEALGQARRAGDRYAA